MSMKRLPTKYIYLVQYHNLGETPLYRTIHCLTSEMSKSANNLRLEYDIVNVYKLTKL